MKQKPAWSYEGLLLMGVVTLFPWTTYLHLHFIYTAKQFSILCMVSWILWQSPLREGISVSRTRLPTTPTAAQNNLRNAISKESPPQTEISNSDD